MNLNPFAFCRIFDEYEDYDFARTGTVATEKVFNLMGRYSRDEY